MLVFLLALLLMFVSACGGDNANTDANEDANNSDNNTEENTNNDGNEAASGERMEFDVNDDSDWPNSVRIGTASVGGTYYIFGGGVASLLDEELGVTSNVEVTGGPNHNIQLIENGDLELGFVTMGPAWDAWHGEEDWTGGVEHKEMRVLYPMYTTYFHFWAPADSGIESIYDLEGKAVGLGPQGGTPGTYLPKFLEVLEINVNDSYAGIGDLNAQMLDGILDAVGFAAGVPFAAALEAEAQTDLNFIGFSEEDLDKIIEAYPYFTKSVIPAGTYQSQEEDMLSAGIWNMAIADKDLSPSFVYNYVDVMMNNLDKMVEVHSASVEMLPENIVHNDFVYMHPGAIKWFEDNGYELPDGVYPPEYPKQ